MVPSPPSFFESRLPEPVGNTFLPDCRLAEARKRCHSVGGASLRRPGGRGDEPERARADLAARSKAGTVVARLPPPPPLAPPILRLPAGPLCPGDTPGYVPFCERVYRDSDATPAGDAKPVLSLFGRLCLVSDCSTADTADSEGETSYLFEADFCTDSGFASAEGPASQVASRDLRACGSAMLATSPNEFAPAEFIADACPADVGVAAGHLGLPGIFPMSEDYGLHCQYGYDYGSAPFGIEVYGFAQYGGHPAATWGWSDATRDWGNHSF